MGPDIDAASAVRRSTRRQVKQRITIRLDKDVLSMLRATGPGWQTRINEILRKAVA